MPKVSVPTMTAAAAPLRESDPATWAPTATTTASKMPPAS
jgi:hypothetical protein